VTKHLAIAAAVAVAALGLSLAAGQGHWRAALVGSSLASATAFASLLAMRRSTRSPKPLQLALAVFTLGFLARLVLVALGTAFVVRAGESVVAFIVAFFVPYFTFAAIEGWYLTGLPKRSGVAA
jgi:RsiW-degrading membrane proteinase PrsW (M82 family)